MRVKKKKETTTDDLAIIIGKGFNHVDKQFGEIGKKISKVENDLNDLAKSNAREHEEIKLRQDEVPYRFELVELQKRIEILERRNGIKIV